MVSAAIVDAQSVKAADTVGRATRGYGGGKKVNGRKRHIVVDTLGLLLVVVVLVVLVTAASVQTGTTAPGCWNGCGFRMPSVAEVWADGGYAGRLVTYARQVLESSSTSCARPRRGTRLIRRAGYSGERFPCPTRDIDGCHVSLGGAP